MRLLALSRTRKCKRSLNEHSACLCVHAKIFLQPFNSAVKALRMTLLFISDYLTLLSLRMHISRAGYAVVLRGQVGRSSIL